MGPGTLLDGRYELRRKLSKGNMGQVWLGWDQKLTRSVAVKTMLADRTEDQDFYARFQREARVAASLHHDRIITVHDYGVDQAEGQYYIVMELLTGQDLKAIITENPGGMPVATVLDLAIQACDGIGAAHAHGVIHRDLKPANIFVEAGNKVKICDFGLAKALDASQSISSTGLQLGTPAYMPPEQWDGKSTVDTRSDLYSLACVLYEMLTGRPPFASAPTMGMLMAQHLATTPAPPAGVEPIPRELSAIVLQMLSKDQDDRPATADLVMARLRQIPLGLAPEPAQVPEPVPAPKPNPVPKLGPGDDTKVREEQEARKQQRKLDERRVLPWTWITRLAGWAFTGTALTLDVGAFIGWESSWWLFLLAPSTLVAAMCIIIVSTERYAKVSDAVFGIAIFLADSAALFLLSQHKVALDWGLPVTALALLAALIGAGIAAE
jgi:serine/threonine protein kinase